jgi:hypothetical protein
MTAQGVFKALILSLFLVIGGGTSAISVQASQTCTPYSVEYVSSGEITQVEGGGAAVPTFMSSLWTPAFNGASWVWAAEYVSNPEDGEVKVFQTTFLLPGEVNKSTLSVSADDYFVASANGVEFASEFGEGNFLPENVFEYELQEYLQKGENTLEFEVTNAKYFYTGEATAELNPAGLLFKLTIEGMECADSPSQTSGGGGKVGPSSVSSGSPASPTTPLASGAQSGSTVGQVMSAQTEEAVESPVVTEDVVDTASETDEKNGTWLPCLLKALILILLIMGLWLVIHTTAKRHSKHAAAAVVDAEQVILALASVLIIVVLWLIGAFCVLPFFVLGMLVVMAWRMFAPRSK